MGRRGSGRLSWSDSNMSLGAGLGKAQGKSVPASATSGRTSTILMLRRRRWTAGVGEGLAPFGGRAVQTRRRRHRRARLPSRAKAWRQRARPKPAKDTSRWRASRHLLQLIVVKKNEIGHAHRRREARRIARKDLSAGAKSWRAHLDRIRQGSIRASTDCDARWTTRR